MWETSLAECLVLPGNGASKIAAAALVRLLETKFVNLNPIIQHMFLTLGDMEEGERKILF